MRTATSLIALSALALPLISHAQIIVGNGQLDLKARVTGTYDSNMNMSRENQEDYYATFNPTATYSRSSAFLENSATIGFVADRYKDYATYNRNSFMGNASSKLPMEKFGDISATLQSSYNESYTSDYSLNKRYLSKIFTAGAQVKLLPSTRTQVDASSVYTRNFGSGLSTQNELNSSLGFQFNQIIKSLFLYSTIQDTRFKSSGENEASVKLDQYSDSFIAGVGNRFDSDISVRLGGGYTILHRSQAEAAYGSRNQGSSVVQFSADGPFLPKKYFPKTRSSFMVAYSNSQTAGINDAGGKTLTGALNLTWQARENTSWGIFTSRSRSIAINDQTLLATSVGSRVEEVLSVGLRLEASIQYNWNKFSSSSYGNRQEGISSTLQAHYTIGSGKHWEATAAYNYQEAKQIDAYRGYDRHMIWLSLNYTY